LDSVHLTTGEQQWTTQPYGQYWSLVAQHDRILALDQRGELLLIRATPEKFDLLDTRKISNQETWGHLAVSARKSQGQVPCTDRSPPRRRT